jgi:ubiquinone/menaquinone biosynthesis C-methylase UbiE
MSLETTETSETRASTVDDAAPSGTADDEHRRRLQGMWAAVAPSWEHYADYVDARGEAVTRELLADAALRPGDQVLELACGPGGLGLAAAPLVGSEGTVVVSDVVAEMTAIAATRAAAMGLHNVTARSLDLEQIAEPDGTYAAVLCREGLMFARDPARAAGEIARVLRPGGRVAIAVWGPRTRNPWLGVVLDAVSAQLGVPMPPPGMPGPFALEDAGRLHGLLVDAGLVDVAVRELPVPLLSPSFEDWWTRTSSLAGPLSAVLAGLPAGAKADLESRARSAVAPYETADGLRFPGLTLLASARRAG